MPGIGGNQYKPPTKDFVQTRDAYKSLGISEKKFQIATKHFKMEPITRGIWKKSDIEKLKSKIEHFDQDGRVKWRAINEHDNYN